MTGQGNHLLAAALAAARPVLVAKLDRLSRDVAFFAGLTRPAVNDAACNVSD
ncbi:hypothetical protein [Mesorhizobium muleiense]|uniref:hypothetical protein n=1 Tax=Mesorhizobium muleiense TaxID=1004279 RepID=UPI001F18E1D8|nr:hypothetical protein [Mesorhizobium muleiense]MCF6113415.1 hypothetical protein [Mesorhizobium muleiense]